MTRSHTLVERHLGGFLSRSSCGNKCGNIKHLCPYSYENMNPLSAGDERVQVAYGKRYLRYFLYEYETALAAAKGTVPKMIWEEVQSQELKDTIEHVLPQTIEGKIYWTERFGVHGEATHARLVHDLGNLTLTKWNTQYSNRPFPEKKGDLGPETIFCYAKAPFYQEQALAGWEEWGPAQIEERRRHLLAWAKERWGVDFSGMAEPSPEKELPDDEDATVVELAAEA